LFWHSDTVHCNQTPTSHEIVGQLRRLVAYVCFSPRSYITEKAPAFAAAREDAVKQQHTTSHWPHLYPMNNHLIYPRHAKFNPISTPPTLSDVSHLSPDALRLLYGR
jgi:hypothetical protein